MAKEKDVLVESERRFKERQRELWKKHPGATIVDGWFKQVQESHRKLREAIGGVRLVKKIALEATQAKADKKACMPLIKQLKAEVPYIEQQLRYQGLEDDDLRSATINIGSHNVLRTGKAIMNWANGDYSFQQDKEKQKRVNKIISDLGNHWARARSDKVEYEVNLTTAAMAFMLLGHYLVDDQSCFRNGGCNHHHKHIIASTDDTFVMLVKNAEDKVISRCWGFASDNYKIFSTFNMYLGKGVLEGNVLNAKKAFFANHFGVDVGQIFCHEDKADVRMDRDYDDDGVYINDYGVFSFTPEKQIKNQILGVNGIGPQMPICPHCDLDYEDHRGWEEIDGQLVCPECVEQATTLPGGVKTLRYTVEVKHPKGKIVVMLEDEVPHDAFTCRGCHYECVREIHGATINNPNYNWVMDDYCRGCLKKDFRKKNGKYVEKHLISA